LRIKGARFPKHAVFKGGFLLSGETRRATIDVVPGPESKDFLPSVPKQPGRPAGFLDICNPARPGHSGTLYLPRKADESYAENEAGL